MSKFSRSRKWWFPSLIFLKFQKYFYLQNLLLWGRCSKIQNLKNLKIFCYLYCISSHSLPGGNQVDGLPPATSTDCGFGDIPATTDLNINFEKVCHLNFWFDHSNVFLVFVLWSYGQSGGFLKAPALGYSFWGGKVMREGRQKCANFRVLKNDDFPDLKNAKISEIFLFLAIVVTLHVFLIMFFKIDEFSRIFENDMRSNPKNRKLEDRVSMYFT